MFEFGYAALCLAVDVKVITPSRMYIMINNFQ